MKTTIACTLALTMVTVLCLAPPGRSDQAIPVSASTEGGGTGTASRYRLTYTIGQPSPVGEASSVEYGLSSGIVGMLLDTAPPGIVHQPVERVAARTAVVIESEISDPRSGVDTVIVFFHEGGLTVFRERPMLKPGGEDNPVYSVALPPSSITERGLVYYIEARDNSGNVARYPQGAPDSLENVSVYFENLSSLETPAGAYRMISLPGIPRTGDPDSVLLDDLGGYDKKSWRLGRWNDFGNDCGERCYQEYPSLEAFAPGKAFWLVTEKAGIFDFTGHSADISRPYTIPLARGWNQIATPFCFPTDWLSAELTFGTAAYSIGDIHAVGADTIFVEDNLISYDGAYRGFSSRLAPWSGYWIYNSSTQEIGLRFDPRAPAPEVAEPENTEPGQRWIDRLDFAVEVSVGTPEGMSDIAFAGMSDQANDGWDAFDLHEPPAIGNFLRVTFPEMNWGRLAGTYMSDVRETNLQGASWEMAVEAGAPARARLQLEPRGEFPENWKVYVYDVAAGIRLDLASLPHSFDIGEGRKFVLVAGTDEFVATEEASSGIGLAPAIVRAVPNPFRRNLEVSCFVPSRQSIKVQAFTVEGRLVSTIVEGVFDEGIHSIVWDGRSSDGDLAAPGLYLIRLETGKTVETRKVMMVR